MRELAALFQDRQVQFSDDSSAAYAEIQVGYQKQPAWYPFLSLHSVNTKFPVIRSGQGMGLGSRKVTTDFLLSIRYESSDPDEGFARLTDLKWDAITTLTQHTTGLTYRYLDIDEAETLVITPEDPDKNLDWGFMGQVLLSGHCMFSNK